jgi:oxygen-independent coproporphyrinogen-3 oxidase
MTGSLREDLLDAARVQLRALDLPGLREAGLLPTNDEFAAIIYYPPLGALQSLEAETAFDGNAPDPRQPLTVYFHIPFCQSHCRFCHCTVSTSPSAGERDEYLAAFERETDIYRARFAYERIPARAALLGGGTPTDMAPAQLRRFFDIVARRFDFQADAQWSCDVDVSTLVGVEGRERLAIMKGAGVGRLTIGVQAFDDTILEAMGRTHSAPDVSAAIANARAAGFQDICLDLIYGYPGQTLESWATGIEAAIVLGVEEVQLYRLALIPYGRGSSWLGTQHLAGGVKTLPADAMLTMRLYASLRLLDAGYSETLTRVFSRSPDFVSRYAVDMYCLLNTTVGFGVTASSSYVDRFMHNSKSLNDYYDRVRSGTLPVAAGVVRSREEQLRWGIVTPLRDWTVTPDRYRALTGRDLATVFRPRVEALKAAGLIEEDPAGMRLTPRGRLVAEQVCQQFYARERVPFGEDCYRPGPLSPYRE